MSDQAEIRDHLLEAALELDADKSKVLKNKDMKDMDSLHQLCLPMIDKWHEADNISNGTWQELLCFRKYMINYKNKCSDA